jgi:hypothetical protein
MPPADADLVDGDALKMLEPGLGEAALEVPLLDLLDHIPAYAQMAGHGLDSHVRAEFQHVAFEGVGVAAGFIGKGHLGLAGLAAGGTPQSLDGQFNPHRLAADGQGAESTGHLAGLHHHPRTAVRTAERVGVLFDAEVDRRVIEADRQLLVAANAPSVIQQACGHGLVSFVKFANSKRDSHVHAFSSPTYAIAG